MFHGAISKAQGCCQRKLQKCVCACEGEGRCGDRTHVFWTLLTNSPPIHHSLPPHPPAAEALAAGSPQGGWAGGSLKGARLQAEQRRHMCAWLGWGWRLIEKGALQAGLH